MIPDRPADYREVVYDARLKTQILVAARKPSCLKLRDDVARPRGRNYRTLLLDDLVAYVPEGAWVLVIVLCPGDTVREAVSWLKRNKGDPARVLFVLHPQTDDVAALADWYEEEWPSPVDCEAASFRQCAAKVGAFVNDWIYQDAKGSGVGPL